MSQGGVIPEAVADGGIHAGVEAERRDEPCRDRHRSVPVVGAQHSLLWRAWHALPWLARSSANVCRSFEAQVHREWSEDGRNTKRSWPVSRLGVPPQTVSGQQVSPEPQTGDGPHVGKGSAPVFLHGVRCREVPVLLLCGPPGDFILYGYG